MEQPFWRTLDELVQRHSIVIDRPKGSAHPRFPHCVYPVDYGYLKDTASMDGGGIDIWVGTAPARQIGAILCTVDLMKGDSEIKILLGCTSEETQKIHQFHNGSPYMKGLLIPRT